MGLNETPPLPLPDPCRSGVLAGPTPLVPVRLEADWPAVWCKLEYLNPSGSTKDRIARYILEKAWRQGRLRPGSRVVEASSGSTSIAIARQCAQMGLRFTAVLPAGVSNERLWMIRAYGGDVELVAREAGIAGAIERAAAMASAEGFFPSHQFTNLDNAEAHRLFTGQEILGQVPGGMVQGVVSGVGTGGTIIGLTAAFRQAGNAVTPFVARPVHRSTFADAECCSFSTRVPGVVEGIETLYTRARPEGLIELEVEDEEAIGLTRRLIGLGFPVGPSSGLNYAAALEAGRRLGPDAVVVTVFPDRMERYFSTELFAELRAETGEAGVNGQPTPSGTGGR